MLRHTPLLLVFLGLLAFGCSESSTPDDAPMVDHGVALDFGPSCAEPCLCQETGGTWDEGACGHYMCGVPNSCEALIPGCDCGAGRSFAEGVGCAADSSCECIEEQCLCESTGGTWDEGACGHYVCGVPNDCRAVIPGCDCGAGSTFVDGAGCAADPGC